jgi:hypothetical protein
LGIFITRISASLVLTRGSLARSFCPRVPLPSLFANARCFLFSSGNWAIASSSRCCFSAAARLFAALVFADKPEAYSGSFNWRRNSAT